MTIRERPWHYNIRSRTTHKKGEKKNLGCLSCIRKVQNFDCLKPMEKIKPQCGYAIKDRLK